MKLNKKIIAYVLSVSFMFGSNTSIAASNPSVTKKLSINEGSKKIIKVKGTFISSKSFKSTNKKIAIVNKKGMVTAKNAGKCKIKVKIKYRKSKKSKKIYKKNFFTVITVKRPSHTEADRTPEVPEVPEIPEVPEVPEIPIPSRIPEATKVPAPSRTPETTKTPAPSRTPEAATTPAPPVQPILPITSRTPETTKAPVPSGTPEATKAPVPSGTPGSTKAPVPSGTPGSTKAPVPSGTPGSTKAPVPSGTPESTKAPVPSGTPGSTKAPVPSGTPESTKAPVPSGTPESTKAPETLESPVPVTDPGLDIKDTGINIKIAANGEYKNWDGVSNVSQFIDGSGRYCFAYDNEENVSIVKTENGLIDSNIIHLKKVHSIFGGITCDSEGNYYLVTGETNTGDDTNQDTIFISKYDAEGNLIKTTGDNGSSSLASYYGTEFYTKEPFSSGNCDIAINGNILTVHYAREMYSGHQSNSVFTVNTESLEKVSVGAVYQSHCFSQRIVPYKNGFVYAGEGDCYNRAFTVTVAEAVNGKNVENDIFHFWVKENTLDNGDMFTLNNNFAHMGGLAVVNGNIALAGTSAKALSAEAENQGEQLFIQIFNPEEDLSSEASYITTGNRTGTGGPNGNQTVTDYGVKWLSDFDAGTVISHPQIVSGDNGTIIILFEKYINNDYKGVYYIKSGADGTIQKDISCLSENACLNACKMPVYSNGKVYWTANTYNDKNNAYIYSFDIQD